MAFESDINFNLLSSKTEGYSGAELAAVCQQAGMLAMEENVYADKVEPFFIILIFGGLKQLI